VHSVLARGFRSTAALAAAGLVFAGSAVAASDQYVVHNLVSSGPAVPADRFDPNLVNPWGLVSSPTSPWWPANNATNTATIYPATGTINSTVVSVPGGPTGIVWNGTAGAFPITGGQSSFIFSTEAGGIFGWRGGTAALPAATHAGAIYKGLALAQTATGPQLYAPDFHNAHVDVYNAQWQLVTVPGGFTDPSLPAGYAPYGIQAIGSRIFVTYAKQDPEAQDEIPGAGLGVVDAFDTAGNLLARVATGGALSAPWGLAQAPPSFGAFGGDLLVGNFGDGRINAFKEGPAGTFTPDGTLQSTTGGPLEIGGLWALEFGSGAANNGSTSTLFFTAGPNGETAGVFGRISANPLSVGGTVAATLSLSLGGPAAFGVFAPGVGKDYTAGTTATVVSTAGDAKLSVADPSTTAPGHLVNGAFSLPQAVQANATSPAGTGAAFAAVGDATTPTTLLTYPGPVTGDPVAVGFKQTIGAGDALRTGTYTKTLTFTLSTTTP
jgi:uncharacterized protein (TIGR03118 family)